MYTSPPTKKGVIAALQALENIERPEGDNEGDAINSDTVYPNLTPHQKELINHAATVTNEYIRKLGVEPNKRSLTELRKAGYPAYLNTDQYDPDRLLGYVKVSDEWKLDLSDHNNQPTDY
jgi:TRAP-type C4-dicarboxylate transport system substrate-binding protein